MEVAISRAEAGALINAARHRVHLMGNFNFTSGFRDVLVHARHLAAELRHDYLAAEHIALALLEGESSDGDGGIRRTAG